MSLSSALRLAFLLHFYIKQVGGNSRTTSPASIFSLSCDLDWNAVREQVIPSPQLWGLSVARGASVFCHFPSRSTAEKENGANQAFQSHIHLPQRLSTEALYSQRRNYASEARGCPPPCLAETDAQAGASPKPRAGQSKAEHGNNQTSQRPPSTAPRQSQLCLNG